VKYVNFVLTLLTLLLSLFIGICLVVSRSNAELSSKLFYAQQTLANARNNEQALRALTLRVAQGTQKDVALRDLLAKEQLKATIDVNGQQKEVP
jgi:hypothetical protein